MSDKTYNRLDYELVQLKEKAKLIATSNYKCYKDLRSLAFKFIIIVLYNKHITMQCNKIIQA